MKEIIKFFSLFALCNIENVRASSSDSISYLLPFKNYISSYWDQESALEKKALCFQRTGYQPVALGINSPALLDFDLSDVNIEKMKKLWYNVQSFEKENNPGLSAMLGQKIVKQMNNFGYSPDSSLTKDEFILDAYCVLAKNGYCPVFNQLESIFQYEKKMKLSDIFWSNSIQNFGTLREYKGYLERDLSVLDESDDEYDEITDNKYRSSNSTDELSDDLDENGVKDKVD